MGVDQPEAAQAAAASAQATPVGELDARAAPDHHVLDGAAAVEQDAHLTAHVVRKRRQLPGQLVGDEAIVREAATSETFEGFDLAGLEAGRVSVDLDGRAPATLLEARVAGGGTDRCAEDARVGVRPGARRTTPMEGRGGALARTGSHGRSSGGGAGKSSCLWRTRSSPRRPGCRPRPRPGLCSGHSWCCAPRK